MERGTRPSGPISAEDERFLAEALALAGRGWGRVHPNPLVGCIIVQDGEIVGRGWHAEWGGDHAEIMALAEAGPRARGATVYVSLEPCNHHGKTPPCSAALIASGIGRVVFGASDPGTQSGGGARTLAEAGVPVTGPVLDEDESRALDPFFFHDHPERPWVALKLAMSLDGKIAAAPGASTRISGPESDAEVQRLRAGFDALMVGSTTAVVDDPRLTVRGEVEPREAPLRVVLDRVGRVRRNARVLTEGDARTLVLTSTDSTKAWRAELRAAGADVEVLDGNDQGRVVESALRVLRGRGIRSVLCEGGGRLGTVLLEAEAVDRLYLIVAPRLIGKQGVPAFPGSDSESGTGPRSARWRHVADPTRRGDDLWLVLEPEER